jgi:hypothetical protein
MRVCVLVVAVVTALSFSSAAEAHGYCDDDIATKLVVDLETLAKGKPATPDNWEGACVAENIAQNKKLKPRLLAACTKILETDPDHTDCIVWTLEVGAKTIGKLDLFEAFAKQFPIDAFEGKSFGMYAFMDDARALPAIREAWVRAANDKRSKNPSRNRKYLLAVWHQDALRLFTSKGTADDAKWLAEQLPKAADKGVRRNMHKAISAIEKRESAK